QFPLLTRSKVLENLIAEQSSENGTSCVLQLDDLPGGTNSFLLVAKFCYGVRIELDALNIVRLRCAAEYLGMTEEYGEGNLMAQTENFLNEVFSHWTDSLQALETCEEVLPLAEELHIVSRCIRSLATKACAELSLFSWPMSACSADVQSPEGNKVCWNGIWTSSAKTHMGAGDDWWYEDVSFLTLPLYKRLIQEVISNGMKPEKVAGALMSYARRYLPLLGRQSSFQNVKQAHPWLTDSEKEQLCRLMNCQRLSLEASTHAAQNERLPLRVIVQVLYFEQLRLRTSVAGWFYVSENLENSQNPNGNNLALVRNDEGVADDEIVQEDSNNVEMRERVLELEKECMSMKQEIEKLVVKNKGSWNMLLRKLGFGRTNQNNCTDDQQPKAAARKIGKESPIPKSTAPLVMNGGDGYHHNDELGS
ncbi:BTB/POZ domain-containing protein At5g03250, partial [Linum perenne]